MTHEEKVELLIRVDERTARMEKWCVEHAAHHQKIFYALLSAIIGVIVTGATTLIELLSKSSGR